MNLFYGLIVGVISYFVAHLVFNQPVSAVIGLGIGAVVAFGSHTYINRR